MAAGAEGAASPAGADEGMAEAGGGDANCSGGSAVGPRLCLLSTLLQVVAREEGMEMPSEPLALPEDICASIVVEMLQALAPLHACRRRHRYVRPWTVAITACGRVELTGSKCIEDSRSSSIEHDRSSAESMQSFVDGAQDRWYWTPEKLMGGEKDGAEVDVWACGAIFAEMLLGSPIFYGFDPANQLFTMFKLLGFPTRSQLSYLGTGYDQLVLPKKHMPSSMRNKLPSLGDDAHDLLMRMLDWCPSTRISAVQALQHPYFSRRVTKCSEARASVVQFLVAKASDLSGISQDISQLSDDDDDDNDDILAHTANQAALPAGQSLRSNDSVGIQERKRSALKSEQLSAACSLYTTLEIPLGSSFGPKASPPSSHHGRVPKTPPPLVQSPVPRPSPFAGQGRTRGSQHLSASLTPTLDGAMVASPGMRTAGSSAVGQTRVKILRKGFAAVAERSSKGGVVPDSPEPLHAPARAAAEPPNVARTAQPELFSTVDDAASRRSTHLPLRTIAVAVEEEDADGVDEDDMRPARPRVGVPNPGLEVDVADGADLVKQDLGLQEGLVQGSTSANVPLKSKDLQPLAEGSSGSTRSTCHQLMSEGRLEATCEAMPAQGGLGESRVTTTLSCDSSREASPVESPVSLASVSTRGSSPAVKPDLDSTDSAVKPSGAKLAALSPHMLHRKEGIEHDAARSEPRCSPLAAQATLDLRFEQLRCVRSTPEQPPNPPAGKTEIKASFETAATLHNKTITGAGTTNVPCSRTGASERSCLEATSARVESIAEPTRLDALATLVSVDDTHPSPEAAVDVSSGDPQAQTGVRAAKPRSHDGEGGEHLTPQAKWAAELRCLQERLAVIDAARHREQQLRKEAHLDLPQDQRKESFEAVCEHVEDARVGGETHDPDSQSHSVAQVGPCVVVDGSQASNESYNSLEDQAHIKSTARISLQEIKKLLRHKWAQVKSGMEAGTQTLRGSVTRCKTLLEDGSLIAEVCRGGLGDQQLVSLVREEMKVIHRGCKDALQESKHLHAEYRNIKVALTETEANIRYMVQHCTCSTDASFAVSAESGTEAELERHELMLAAVLRGKARFGRHRRNLQSGLVQQDQAVKMLDNAMSAVERRVTAATSACAASQPAFNDGAIQSAPKTLTSAVSSLTSMTSSLTTIVTRRRCEVSDDTFEAGAGGWYFSGNSVHSECSASIGDDENLCQLLEACDEAERLLLSHDSAPGNSSATLAVCVTRQPNNKLTDDRIVHARPDTHADTSVCDSQRSLDNRDISRGCGTVASPTQGSLTVYRSIGVGRTPSTIKKSVGGGKTASRYGMSEAGATGRIQNSFGCREGGNSRVARGSRPSSPGESTLITAACSPRPGIRCTDSRTRASQMQRSETRVPLTVGRSNPSKTVWASS